MCTDFALSLSVSVIKYLYLTASLSLSVMKYLHLIVSMPLSVMWLALSLKVPVSSYVKTLLKMYSAELALIVSIVLCKHNFAIIKLCSLLVLAAWMV